MEKVRFDDIPEEPTPVVIQPPSKNGKNFAEPKATDSQKTSELVAAGDDIIYKYGLAHENPDELIATKGWDYIQKEIESDTHLASQLATRRQKLIKKGYQIRPAEKAGKSTARSRMIADFVSWNLQHMRGSFEKDLEAMLDAIGKGFSLSEINYKYLDSGPFKGYVGLKSIRFKPAKYFSFKFDKWGHYWPRQVDPNPAGIDLPLNKFIHLITGFNDENPYGESISSKCAFWVWLKKNGAKFWAIYSERFGMPIVKVMMPQNPTPADKTAAEQVIVDIQTRAGIRVPKNFEVDFMEAVRQGDVYYDNFIERCNKEISKIVLGATLTTEEGKRGQGSYALGKGHTNIMEDYVVFDASITSQAVNEQLIKRLVDLNFDTKEYPVFTWLGVNISSLISFSQSIGVLVDKGFNVPVSYIRDMTGIPEPKDGEEILQPTPTVQPAGPAQQDNRAGNFMFEDVPPELQEEVAELVRLQERYLNLTSRKFEELTKKFKSSLEKKKN